LRFIIQRRAWLVNPDYAGTDATLRKLIDSVDDSVAQRAHYAALATARERRIPQPRFIRRLA